ncbi:hypothetical protein H8N00_25345 [Streptomyces sp. AC563]|uniref:hypothetical protein n=1 Tax=Streptomyces buecherae TaxID=2763006 RepID=UPI00164DBC3F|nr:hypothetical protein [Streptomyces buecherae]MBC3992145.1 hypothetical protein [Streptomyces buecherae]
MASAAGGVAPGSGGGASALRMANARLSGLCATAAGSQPAYGARGPSATAS